MSRCMLLSAVTSPPRAEFTFAYFSLMKYAGCTGGAWKEVCRIIVNGMAQPEDNCSPYFTLQRCRASSVVQMTRIRLGIKACKLVTSGKDGMWTAWSRNQETESCVGCSRRACHSYAVKVIAEEMLFCLPWLLMSSISYASHDEKKPDSSIVVLSITYSLQVIMNCTYWWCNAYKSPLAWYSNFLGWNAWQMDLSPHVE